MQIFAFKFKTITPHYDPVRVPKERWPNFYYLHLESYFKYIMIHHRTILFGYKVKSKMIKYTVIRLRTIQYTLKFHTVLQNCIGSAQAGLYYERGKIVGRMPLRMNSASVEVFKDDRLTTHQIQKNCGKFAIYYSHSNSLIFYTKYLQFEAI